MFSNRREPGILDQTDVILADTVIPSSLKRVLETANGLAPWTEGKIRVEALEVPSVRSMLQDGTAILSSHGCDALTDHALDLGISTNGPLAVMPCCCHPRSPEAPEVLYRELGIRDGVDVHRTYRLNDAGYRVLWRYIPVDITPMNRIIIDTRR